MSDIDVDAFLSDICSRPPIWDGSFGNKDYLWNEISEVHGVPVRELKTKWENLCMSFFNLLKKIPRNSENGFLINPHEMHSDWPYYQSMLFMVYQTRTSQPITVNDPASLRSVCRKRPNVEPLAETSTKRRNPNEVEICNMNQNDSDTSLASTVVYNAEPNRKSSLNWHDENDSSNSGDSDRFYLKSLLYYFERMDASTKLRVRLRIDHILEEECSNM